MLMFVDGMFNARFLATITDFVCFELLVEVGFFLDEIRNWVNVFEAPWSSVVLP